jgi:hypothetical protein
MISPCMLDQMVGVPVFVVPVVPVVGFRQIVGVPVVQSGRLRRLWVSRLLLDGPGMTVEVHLGIGQ